MSSFELNLGLQQSPATLHGVVFDIFVGSRSVVAPMSESDIRDISKPRMSLRSCGLLLIPPRPSLLLLRLHFFRERPQRLVHVVETLLPFGAGHEGNDGGIAG